MAGVVSAVFIFENELTIDSTKPLEIKETLSANICQPCEPCVCEPEKEIIYKDKIIYQDRIVYRNSPVQEQSHGINKQEVLLDSICRNKAGTERIDAEQQMKDKLEKIRREALAGKRKYWEDYLSGIPNPMVRNDMVNGMLEAERKRVEGEITDTQQILQAEIDKRYYEAYNKCLSKGL